VTVTNTTATEVKNIDSPDDRRRMEHGVVDLVNLSGATIGRATFAPGWKWSTQMKPLVGTDSCQVAHTGIVLSGRFHVRMDDGREFDLGPGDAHVVAPGHDAWVVGDEPVVALDIAMTGGPVHGHVGRCPCGVEFRVATSDQLDHLVAAIREHANASHGYEMTDDQILAEVHGA
jgi:mannose-6-phosphate isomerase-like protein (cupin superfamily)